MGGKKLKSRFQMSGVRCQVSDVRCQVSGVRCQVSDVRCQVSGVRCQISDIRYQMSGKTRVKKQQKQKTKELSEAFGFYTLLHLLTTAN